MAVRAPYKFRNREYTSVPTAVAFDPPIRWIQVVGAGNVVAKDEGGTTVTYASVSAGEVLIGPFSELTSTTSSKLRLGDGQPPEVTITGVESSSATSLTTTDSSNLSTTVSSDTSLASRLSVADSTVTSTLVSADTSLASRLSVADSVVTSSATSLASSLTTRDSALTSITTSLQTRISTAESVEASKG